MENQWQIVDQLTKEKDLIRDRAMKLLTEEKRKYISDLSKYKSHIGKMDNKVKSQKGMQTQTMKDIAQMRDNLREKVQELIVIGVDFDEKFYEMRDDEELKWEAKHDVIIIQKYNLDISQIAKNKLIQKSLKVQFARN